MVRASWVLLISLMAVACRPAAQTSGPQPSASASSNLDTQPESTTAADESATATPSATDADARDSSDANTRKRSARPCWNPDAPAKAGQGPNPVCRTTPAGDEICRCDAEGY